MKTAMFAIVAASLLLSACSKVADAPTEEKLRRDLVGREFRYAFDKSAGSKTWSIKEGEVKEFIAYKGRTRDSGKTCEVPALATISDGKLTIRGMLVYRYSRAESEWKLSSVSARYDKPGKSFTFLVLVCGS
jgi:hypothetical protein